MAEKGISRKFLANREPALHKVNGKDMSETIETLALMQHYGIRAQKKYGQNFLTDEAILRGIVEAAQVTGEDTVLEIGPGLGALTRYLSDAAGRVIAVEIDEKLLPLLRDRLRDRENVELVHADIMEVSLEELLSKHAADMQGKTLGQTNPGTKRKLKVVANLPYYITKPILLRLLETPELFESITVMVQKEVAERLKAVPGTKDYGAITLAVQYYTTPQIRLDVPREAFLPPPGVDSAVIRLTLHEKPPVSCADEATLFRVIRAAFHQRRKTLVNALKNAPELSLAKETIEAAIASLEKPLTVRGEVLTLEEFARLTEALYQ